MYKFQKNDLVICKPAEDKRSDNSINFEIYARVVDVEREKDILYLDCYLKQGRVHMESRINKALPLFDMEYHYYQPMNYKEIMQFHDGLCDFISSPKYKNNIFYRNDINASVVQTTLDIVNKAIEKHIAKDNEPDENYERIEFFGRPALFTNDRITDADVPKGMYCYHLRHGNDGNFCALENYVFVNYAGSIILKEPLDLGKKGYITITNDNAPNFSGETMSLYDFRESDGSADDDILDLTEEQNNTRK